MEMKKVGVAGAGMMGAEIALCFAVSGFDVLLTDKTVELAVKAKDRLGTILDKSIQKKKFEAEKKSEVMERLVVTDGFSAFSDVDLIVEAVIENFELKKEVFQQLDEVCKSECLFATNTSSIPITLLASTVGPQRTGAFIGAHFFSPAFRMKLVEVIPGLETIEKSVSAMMERCRAIDKTPIRVKDVTGFAVNRILHAMWIEANRLLEEGVATPEDIDTACKLGLGHPVGPYALMDLTGNDLNLKVQKILHDSYGERFMPRPILKQKVIANHLGRKTKRGWYEYK
jgi:3-hydroxybutyryl-CoA dehydrogenase